MRMDHRTNYLLRAAHVVLIRNLGHEPLAYPHALHVHHPERKLTICTIGSYSCPSWPCVFLPRANLHPLASPQCMLDVSR